VTIGLETLLEEGSVMNLKRRLFWLGLGVVLSVVAGACTGGPRSVVESTRTEAGSDRGGGSPPMDFEIDLYQGADAFGGETVLLSEVLALGNPVVLNFWAGLCPPCRVEMPDFQEIHEGYRDRVIVLGVDVGPFTALGTREQGRALIDEIGVTYPAGTTFREQVVEAYRVLGMPTTVFLAPEGEVVRAWTGLLPRDKMLELTEDLLAETE
jgi:thiol-disulfide isomerase/thioredoxin